MPDDAPPPTEPLLARWARFVIARRVLVIAVWVLILALGAVTFSVVEKGLGMPDYLVYGSDSARTETVLHEKFPNLGAEQDAVVILAPAGDAARDTALEERITRIEADVARDYAVAGVLGPYTPLTGAQFSADGSAALILVALRHGPAQRSHAAQRIQEIADTHLHGTPYRAYVTGQAPLNNALTEVETADQQLAEFIGLPIAFLVLMLVLRSFVAALIPLLTAVSGVLLSSIGILALAGPMRFDTFAVVVATVLGLGVGIDYALFVVGRMQEELARDGPVEEAIVTAMRTSGHTVLSAGFIVVIALGSLVLIRGHLFIELPVVSALVILASMTSAMTLLPAVLAVLGRRVTALPPRLPAWAARRVPRRSTADEAPTAGEASTAGETSTADESLIARWTRVVMRRPLATGLPALAALILLALPLGSINLGLDLGMASLGHTDAGRGVALVSDKYGAGAVSPIQVVACAPTPLDTDGEVGRLGALVDRIDADPRVESTTSIVAVLDGSGGGRTRANLDSLLSVDGLRSATTLLVDEQRRCAYIAVQARDPVDSTATLALIDDLRAMDPGPGTDLTIGGMTAQYRDLAGETARKLPWVVLVVVGLSFVYLVVVFGSVVLPIKSTILNVLATAASIGATVAVFQFGWGERIFDFTSPGTVQAFLPVALFAILFGLSMDYEVLIVGRIAEEYAATGDLDSAVPRAMARSGRQVSAAAAIMAAVFGSLVLGDVLELKQLGFGLAFAVILDATVVRMVLVPAAMVLMGDNNWWMPRWVSRLIPAKGVHG